MPVQLLIYCGLEPQCTRSLSIHVHFTEQSYRVIACAFEGNKHANSNSN